MGKIIETILNQYEDLDFISLARTNYKRERINLELISNNLDGRYNYSINILKSELGKHVNGLIMFFSKNSKTIRKYMVEGVKKRGINNIINRGKLEIYKIPYENRFYLHCYWVENLNDSEIEILIKGLIEMDHAIEPCIHFKTYFFKKDFGKLLNLYDDRGIDIIQKPIKFFSKI